MLLMGQQNHEKTQHNNTDKFAFRLGYFGNNIWNPGMIITPEYTLGERATTKRGKTKVKLPYEMWSMDKIKPSTDAVEKWKKKYTGPYVVSAKLDGISALYVSEDGKAPKLYTRGNGKEGQDISQMIPYLIKDEIKEYRE